MPSPSKPRQIAILLLGAALAAGSIASAAVTKTGSFYVVKVETSGSGDARVAKITTTGKNGYHCNMLYPWKLTLTPGRGVTLARTAFKKGDAKQFAEAAVVFEVPYQASAGAEKITAALKLSLCDDKQCQMETVDISWPAR
jgi:hypothetical protein